MKNKIIKTVLKSLLIVSIIVVIALSGYFILKSCGLTTADDFIKLREKLGDNFSFWLIVGLLQVFQVIFIPVSNQLITVPLALCFPQNELWKVWLTSWISIWAATIVLYFIGRFGGKKILDWILDDKEQVEKCSNFLKKGWLFYPIAMLLPLPDDIVTVLSGTAKMPIIYILISSFFTRAIDVACSVFGIGLLTRFWWGWIILAVGILLLTLITIIFTRINKNVKSK